MTHNFFVIDKRWSVYCSARFHSTTTNGWCAWSLDPHSCYSLKSYHCRTPACRRFNNGETLNYKNEISVRLTFLLRVCEICDIRFYGINESNVKYANAFSSTRNGLVSLLKGNLSVSLFMPRTVLYQVFMPHCVRPIHEVSARNLPYKHGLLKQL